MSIWQGWPFITYKAHKGTSFIHYAFRAIVFSFLFISKIGFEKKTLGPHQWWQVLLKKKKTHYATLNKLSRLTITSTTESLVDIQ